MKDKSVLLAAFEKHPIVTLLVLVMPFGFVVWAIAALVKWPRGEKREEC